MPVSRCNFKQMYLCCMVNVLFWNEMKMKENKRKKKKKNTRIVKYLKVINIEIKEREFFPGELLVFYIY